MAPADAPGAPPQHSLALIVAREFASSVTVPVILVDATNSLVFYNESAAAAFGAPYGAGPSLSSGDWARRFQPAAPGGAPLERSALPVVTALEQGSPAHAEVEVTAPDGGRVVVAMTAIPLFSAPGELAGAMLVGWTG